MRIGFIGAGKCGMSLAYYFRSKGLNIIGFCSGRADTESDFDYFKCEELVQKSDIIFVTVTDTAIAEVWDGIKKFNLQNKIICHCSGSLSSEVFAGANEDMVCSVHPLLAFNSVKTSIDAVSKAYFTLEGGRKAVDTISQILSHCSNRFIIIQRENKIRYHAAACFASNFVAAVCAKAEELLLGCGFDQKEAQDAFAPLMRANMENIISCGAKNAVTGPAARGDRITIQKHLEVLDDDTKELYENLTRVITNIKMGEK